MRGVIWLWYARLDPLSIVKLGAIPQPILAAVVLMSELHKAGHTKSGEQAASDCVDIEHLIGQHPYYASRCKTKE